MSLSHIELESEDTIPDRLSLREYLANALLPAFQCSNSAQSRAVQIKRAPQWPKYTELPRAPGTRQLKRVQRIDLFKFALLAQDYMNDVAAGTYILNEALVQDEKSLRLRLPSSGLVEYEEEDIEFLSNVNNEDDFTSVVLEYVLGTISESIRLIEGFSLESPEAAALQFRKSSYLCAAHRARWDIFTLAPIERHPDRLPFSVFLISPWDFGIKDFDEFTSSQLFENHNLDTLPAKPRTITDTLWAVIHDTCRGNGKYFVVSNYTRWAFGKFNSDWTLAWITQPLEAPILNLDGSSSSTPSFGFNVIEYLTFWTHHALRTT